jgi:hypothetical protein
MRCGRFLPLEETKTAAQVDGMSALPSMSKIRDGNRLAANSAFSKPGTGCRAAGLSLRRDRGRGGVAICRRCPCGT